MPGAGRDQHGGAGRNLRLYVVDDDETATTNDDVDLLAPLVRMQTLLASGLAGDPGDGQVRRIKLRREQKVRNLAAALVARRIVSTPHVH